MHWLTFQTRRELGTSEITQKAFTESMLNRFDVKLCPREEGGLGGDCPSREAVGSLMWLFNMTRPDISNAVRAVERYSHNPTDRHWIAVRKAIAYLYGTNAVGFTFVRRSRLVLTTYSDADHADKSNDRRSVSTTVVAVGSAAVSWTSSTQK